MRKGQASMGRKAACVALAGVSLTAAIVAALPGVAQAAPGPARTARTHALGLKRSPGAVVLPQAGVRALSTLAARSAALPASVDLSRYDERVGDQGNVGSCAAWAIGYGMMGWFARRQGHAGAPYAPMYAYSQVNGGVDNGTSPAAVLEVLRTQGIDTAAHYAQKHPNSHYDWRHRPSAAERARAAANRIAGWVTLYNTYRAPGSVAITAVKRTLASGRPVALSIAVYNRFMYAYGAPSVVSSRGNLGQLLGYHEVLAVGYDRRGVRIQNSWGTSWGNRGYAILDWNYIAQHTYEAETIAGLSSTTGASRPAVTSVTPGAGSIRGGQLVTVTGARLNSALLTLGTRTFAPAAVASNGRYLTFRVPAGLPGAFALRISTPGGVNAGTRSFRYTR